MKKVFDEVQIGIVPFCAQDIITASPTGTSGSGSNPIDLPDQEL